MLKAWVQPEVQHWLSRSLDQLRKWRQAQNALLRDMGWAQQPSDSPFGVARPPLADAPATTQGDGGGKGHGDLAAMLAFMRARGVKLRDTASMGLPGWLRLSVRPPADQDALRDAWQAFLASRSISTNAVSA
jgi:histidinol-phosphate aminotransferase